MKTLVEYAFMRFQECWYRPTLPIDQLFQKCLCCDFSDLMKHTVNKGRLCFHVCGNAEIWAKGHLEGDTMEY